MAERYVGVNCDRCGRFVGRDGVVGTYDGDRWANCRRCLTPTTTDGAAAEAVDRG